MSNDLVWEEPPAAKGGAVAGPGRYAEIAAKLRSRAGEWARIGAFTRTGELGAPMSAVRHGRGGFEPKGSFEATSRTVKRGMEGYKVIHLYVRYVGGETA